VESTPEVPTQVSGLTELHDRGRMTWTERERGWVAVPDEVVNALARGGFEECKLEMTTSRRDLRPAGGIWQGLNRTTGSVASAVWVNRAAERHSLVFIEVDGERVEVDHGETRRANDALYTEDGGES
jgi:hypothetical protein